QCMFEWWQEVETGHGEAACQCARTAGTGEEARHPVTEGNRRQLVAAGRIKVRLEAREAAGILTGCKGLEDAACQQHQVAQRQVVPLPCHGMQTVRDVAEQDQMGPDLLLGNTQAERMQRALPDAPETAEALTEVFLQGSE